MSSDSHEQAKSPHSPTAPFEFLFSTIDGPVFPSEGRSRTPDTHISDRHTEPQGLSAVVGGLQISVRSPAESLPPTSVYLCSPFFLHWSMYLPRAARPVASRRVSSTRTGAKIRTTERDVLWARWKVANGCHQISTACCAPRLCFESQPCPLSFPRRSEGTRDQTSGQSQWKGPQPPLPTPGDTFSWVCTCPQLRGWQ